MEKEKDKKSDQKNYKTEEDNEKKIPENALDFPIRKK